MRERQADRQRQREVGVKDTSTALFRSGEETHNPGTLDWKSSLRPFGVWAEDLTREQHQPGQEYFINMRKLSPLKIAG